VFQFTGIQQHWVVWWFGVVAACLTVSTLSWSIAA